MGPQHGGTAGRHKQSSSTQAWRSVAARAQPHTQSEACTPASRFSQPCTTGRLSPSAAPAAARDAAERRGRRRACHGVSTFLVPPGVLGPCAAAQAVQAPRTHEHLPGRASQDSTPNPGLQASLARPRRQLSGAGPDTGGRAAGRGRAGGRARQPALAGGPGAARAAHVGADHNLEVARVATDNCSVNDGGARASAPAGSASCGKSRNVE